MISLKKAEIPGVYIVFPSIFQDKRGSVVKYFQKSVANMNLLNMNFSESIISTNKDKGTFRGFHFQKPPYAQSKLCVCLSGGWYNYLLDIRLGSPTYGRCIQILMDEEINQAIYIPEGIANGQFVLKDNTRVLYYLTNEYNRDSEGGILWDSVTMDLPEKPKIISEKDMNYLPFEDFQSPFMYV